jgi:hypothetical protein
MFRRNLGGDAWLLAVFGERLALGMIHGPSPDQFRRGDQVFQNRDHGDLTAFYDRLVDAAGHLVGIRVWPVGRAVEVLTRLPEAVYLRRPDGQSFEFYFAPVAKEQATSTGDQAFGGKFFETPNDLLAMSLDFSYLAESEEDYNRIHIPTAEWIPVQV